MLVDAILRSKMSRSVTMLLAEDVDRRVCFCSKRCMFKLHLILYRKYCLVKHLQLPDVPLSHGIERDL